MAAMRYAARRLLSGQPPQPIYRAAVAEEQRRLLPTVIHGGSSAYSRRFISMQRSEAERPTFEGKWRIYRRGAHLIFRTTKAVSTIVASGIILKLSLNELFAPGYLVAGAASLIQRSQDMMQGLRDNTLEAEVKSLLKDGNVVEAQMAELDKDGTRLDAQMAELDKDGTRLDAQMAELDKDGTTLDAQMAELKSLLAEYESQLKDANQMEVESQ